MLVELSASQRLAAAPERRSRERHYPQFAERRVAGAVTLPGAANGALIRAVASSTKWDPSIRSSRPWKRARNSKPSLRARADKIKDFRCKNLIAVIEQPDDLRNIGTIIRNVNALGVEKAYVITDQKSLPDDWQEMRSRSKLNATSASAIKWSFVRKFNDTESCLAHLERRDSFPSLRHRTPRVARTSSFMKPTTPRTKTGGVVWKRRPRHKSSRTGAERAMREHSDVRNYRELKSRHFVWDRALRDQQATTRVPEKAQSKDRRQEQGLAADSPVGG